MNADHLRICASAEWAETVARVLLPWAVGSRPLGGQVLEVGAGPGLVTELLARQVPWLVALELDPVLAAGLGRRFDGGVRVVRGDATRLPFADRRFSAVACFTMLHHVPSAALQDRMLAELCRVLRPGGLLAGTDGMDTPERRRLHVGDVFVPADPAALAGRLRAAGFADPEVELDPGADRFRFAAVAT
jgi:ubiquinone/menaquinone biosynthesis C-methylase UbiE